MLVQVEDVTARLPSTVLPLSRHDEERVFVFLADAEQVIVDAFLREGRLLDHEMELHPWLRNAVVRVVREMASASVVVSETGVRSASSTTGPQSDSVTYKDIGMVSFSGPRLTDELRKELGLSVAVRSRGRFPDPPRWPEVRLR